MNDRSRRAMVKIIFAENKEILDLCLYVRNRVFTVERNVPEEIEVDEQDVPGSACDHFLIVCDEKPAGALRCMRMDEKTIKLQRFCVLKEYRRLGLGKEAVSFVEDFYRERSFSKVEMDSKFEASGFYEKCGYRKVSDIFEEAGIPHVKMVKELPFRESVP